MIKAILFDLHGVLFTNSTKDFIEKLSKESGLSKDKIVAVFDKGVGIDYREGRVSREQFWDHVAQGLNLTDMEKLEDQWISEYRLIEGTKEIILELMRKYRIFYLSDNIEERIKRLNDKHGFLAWFEGGLSSHEVGVRKPHPRMYEQAIEKIDLLPQEILFVDDKDINLPPAQKLGMATVLFTSPQDLKVSLTKLNIL